MKERINITIEPELLERIDYQANAEHTSRSALIRRVMRGYVDGGRTLGGEAHAKADEAAEAPAVYAAPGPSPVGDASLDTAASLLGAFFAARDDIESVWVFGSLAQGRSWKASDVDVAVLQRDASMTRRETEELRVDLSSRLEQLLGRIVDVVFVNEGSTLLRYRIVSEGAIVYGDGVAAAEARMRAISDHIEFRSVVAEGDRFWEEKVRDYDSI
jgi:predicted nucleotidyltransferase